MTSEDLEETVRDFIKAARRQNVGTASILKSISDKLALISKKEEDLVFIEKTKTENLEEIKNFLTTLEKVLGEKEDEGGDTLGEIFSQIQPIKSQLESLEKNTSLSREEIKEILANQQEIFNSSFKEFQSIISKKIEELENSISDVQRIVGDINSKLMAPSGVIKDISLEGKDIIVGLPQQIIYKSEEDKITVLSIIDSLLFVFSGESPEIELEGTFIKQMLISARSQVYDQTEGIAPRFRQAMDSLLALFEDEAIYPVAMLTSVVESLKKIKDIYEAAAIDASGS